MSTSHDHAAVLYVVSRSGKVLKNEERSRRFTVDGDYFEGELEGWIFWGSSGKGNASNHDRSERRQDGFIGRSPTEGYIGNSLDNLGRVSWTTKIPFASWGDDTDSIQDVFSPMDWTHSLGASTLGRNNTPRRRDGEAWEDANLNFKSPLAGCWEPHEFFRSERWYRMEQYYKIGLAQVAILQKSDIARRWDPGTRELAARWASWLLKMLRRTRSPALQHMLFNMFSAVLPGICCSLVRQQWTRVRDQELCRIVDIVWKALEKSHECFTSVQWEILEERLLDCRKMQMKVESSAGRSPRGVLPMESVEDSLCREQLKTGLSDPSCRPSEDTSQQFSNSRDQQLSNVLLQSEGVPALVKRALRDKLSSNQLRRMDGTGSHGFSDGSGRIVSLVCPISGKRIKVPARARDCNHLSSFDLESFLEEHAKNDRRRPISVHQQKRPKMETRAWCCPICGADAMWPQLIVDRMLLRILEVLPENMLEVCLLPNGRWHVVWSPVGLGLGQNDTKLTRVAVHLPFKSAHSKDDIYGSGLSGALRNDTFNTVDRCLGYQQSYGCREVQILHRAYKAWKDGVDHHISRGGDNSEHSKFQWGANSTIALWTDGDNSSRNSFWGPSAQKPINLREPASRIRGGISSESVNDVKEDSSGNTVVDNVARISEAEASDDPQNAKAAGRHESEISTASKMILQASEEISTRLRIGQLKSRPKLMARKT